MDKDILLIDGNSMLFRAYYATLYGGARMSTKNGISTNAVYAFVNMINKAINKIDPSYVMVAWDTGKPTFRHEKYEAYKGTRKELDPELKVQFPIAREFLDAYGIYRYEKEGIEADDIIGSIAKQFKDYKCHILSSDNDLLQLIDDTTDVLLMKKGISDLQIMDEKELMALKGVTPLQIIEMKGLMGDASDNIPGVKGIGEKTAVKLLSSYETVEGVYEHIDELKGKLKEKLIDGKDSAFMSKDLATIKLDCQLPCTIKDFEFDKDKAQLNEFFKKYEMNSFVEKETSKININQLIIKEVEDLPSDYHPQEAIILLDYDNNNYYSSELYGIAICDLKRILYLDKDAMLSSKRLQDFLNSDTLKISYDVKMAYHLLNRYGFAFLPFDIDLKIVTFLNDNVTNTFKKLCSKYHVDTTLDEQEVYGKAGKEIVSEKNKRMQLLSEMVNILNIIKDKETILLEKNKMTQLLHDVEMPLACVLYEMETTGINTSLEVLKDIQNKTEKILNDLEKEIFSVSNEEFNLNSPKQLSEVLFDHLGLKANKKRSTAIDVLEKLSGSHPIIDLIIKYRKYQKINSTYAIGLQKHILKDGKIHTLFHQCLTQTGRLSSSDPNLQNLSVKDEEAREIRKAFVASENHVIYAADYSQIELRVLAHMANETNMIEAFKNGIDIHTKTAMSLFNVGKDDVTSLMRRQAKTVNFGMVYGQTAFGLASELHISANEAKKFMDAYFKSYPNIKSFMDQTITFCEEHGYVMTMFNRRRIIPEINDKNYMTREFGKRAAMNAPIQGSAADLIKMAMIKVNKELKDKKVKSKMVLQIHDELVFDVLKEEKELVEQIVQDAMCNVFKLKVPLIADGKFANSYYEAK